MVNIVVVVVFITQNQKEIAHILPVSCQPIGYFWVEFEWNNDGKRCKMIQMDENRNEEIIASNGIANTQVHCYLSKRNKWCWIAISIERNDHWRKLYV